MRYVTTTAHAPLALSFEERFIVALMRSGMKKSEFAKYVGTTAKTLWTWETLQVTPAEGALRILAQESGMDFDYLRPDEQELLEAGLLKPVNDKRARRDSNPQPSDWRSAVPPQLSHKLEASKAVRRHRHGQP